MVGRQLRRDSISQWSSSSTPGYNDHIPTAGLLLMIIQAPVHTKPNQDSLCPYNAMPQASQSFSPQLCSCPQSQTFCIYTWLCIICEQLRFVNALYIMASIIPAQSGKYHRGLTTLYRFLLSRDSCIYQIKCHAMAFKLKKCLDGKTTKQATDGQDR